MKNSKIINIEALGFPWKTQDPFLFCAHHRDEYPKGNKDLGLASEDKAGRNIGQDFVVKDGYRMYHGSSIPVFPYHPHRGFETITINKEGFVDHTDSLGGAGRFGAGDVQWMTAGKGIQHSEMFPMVYDDKPNPLEIFQVWLNLPKASKFVAPHFRMLWNDMVPVVKHKDDQGAQTEIHVIAGHLNNTKAAAPTPDSWAATVENDVAVFTIKMEANAKWQLPAAANGNVNRTLYFYRGTSLNVAGEQVDDYHLIQVNPNEEILLENGDSEGYLLMLQGKPIDEPVAQYGPFVMNTEEEIHEAFADYRRTEFGGWPWPEKEQIHPREKPRFALYANGEEEVK